MGIIAGPALEYPFTPPVLSTVPIRMPTVNVNRMTRVNNIRWVLMRAIKAVKREFILDSSSGAIALLKL
jgi:hypothetical protein